jgi:hypothetical protein
MQHEREDGDEDQATTYTQQACQKSGEYAQDGQGQQYRNQENVQSVEGVCKDPPDRHPERKVQVGEVSRVLGSSDAR